VVPAQEPGFRPVDGDVNELLFDQAEGLLRVGQASLRPLGELLSSRRPIAVQKPPG
jgi:hypothetical protein